jgi:sterol desaturase/sphingolipid hydroxylase (fatty acid hydroxylase superfamily)
MQELQAIIINNESTIRLSFFFTIFFIMAILEYIIPKRTLHISKIKRWFNNISLVFLNTLIIRILFPIAAVGVAIFAKEHNFGIFNIFELHNFFKIIFCIVLLDLIIYWQHRFFHTIGFFWKFHKVHHSDMDYDVTTGFRFHPIEIIFSMLIKFFFILVLGAPIISVVCFEIILSTLAIFNHSNINLSKKLDFILKLFIVTPDMHRIHHSIYSKELNSNYGFNISLWDRVFNSYTSKAKDNQEKLYKHRKNNLNRMKSKTSSYVVVHVTMMNFMKLPEETYGMKKSMLPVYY